MAQKITTSPASERRSIRPLVLERQRSAHQRHQCDRLTEDNLDLIQITADLENENEDLGTDLDQALTALCLLKLYYEQATARLNMSYPTLLEMRGYRMAEELLAKHGISSLNILLGGDSDE